mmetsp:Transcript_70581/g.222970  ORF Transcript_70581/g.222970 Transcript_70581/m.222970 type:complete len:260 (+) Transcript_70581:714-1493(+)
MRAANSSLSMTPLPSASASRNASRRKLRKSSRSASRSLASTSSLSEAADTMLSDATAVRMDIMVQEPNTMKVMKNSCHRQSLAAAGPATSIQLSSVATWNSEKTARYTSPKLSCRLPTSSGEKPAPLGSLRPRSFVQKMAPVRMKRNRTMKITAKRSIIVTSAMAKAASFLEYLKDLISLRRRSNLRARSAGLRRSEPRAKGTNTSRTPRARKTPSKAIQYQSTDSMDSGPKQTTTHTISDAKSSRKEKSKRPHAQKSG